jgi:hypothetical protein
LLHCAIKKRQDEEATGKRERERRRSNSRKAFESYLPYDEEGVDNKYNARLNVPRCEIVAPKAKKL